MARLRIVKIDENDYRVEERILGLFWRRTFYNHPYYDFGLAKESIEYWASVFWKDGAKQVKHRPWFPSNVVAVFKGYDYSPFFDNLWKF
jgi:hypothetical protein